MAAGFRPRRFASHGPLGGGRLTPANRLPLVGLGAAVSANAALGIGLATGRAPLAAAGAALPVLALAFGALVASNRGVLIFGALALEFSLTSVNDGLELPGGVVVFAADVIVGLAFLAWLAARLAAPPEGRPRRLRTPVLGVALVLFALALLVGLVRGSGLYDASLLGMPLRLVLYAGIAFAVVDLTPREALRGITVVFYLGTVWQTFVGAYHLATGTSATTYLELSTGGTRYLGISVATYLAGALVLALLNLHLSRTMRWRLLHLFIAALATFGVTIAFTRAVFLAVAVILPVLFLSFGRLRRTLLPFMPAVAVLLAVSALLMPLLAPQMVSTLESRLTTRPAVDSSVAWRDRAYEVAMAGVSEQPLLGVGFGRQSTFYIDGMPNVIEGDPHNGFIYLLAGGGAFALATFLILLGVYLRDAWRRLWFARAAEEQVLVVWAVATWFIFMLHSLVEPVLTYPSMILTIWITMLLPTLVMLRGDRSPAPQRIRSKSSRYTRVTRARPERARASAAAAAASDSRRAGSSSS